MKHLTCDDLDAWLVAVTAPSATAENLPRWIEEELQKFFPCEELTLCHGKLVTERLRVTHILIYRRGENFSNEAAMSFEFDSRNAICSWIAERRPFLNDLKRTSAALNSSDIALNENIASHGVWNFELNAGTYFEFSGVRSPLSQWHAEALRILTPVLNDLFLSYIFSKKKLIEDRAEISSFAGGLPPRAKAIVHHLAEGKSNKAIAKMLGISEKTVRNQLTRIYACLGVYGRSELIVKLR